ncbi:MAG TPA: 2-hydroxychromene-2-carboxylate isomerase [Ramlibacter sp.]|nr:2-hydroxychromene-2-carboxylate isomerase [Ramlibacter sp.]
MAEPIQFHFDFISPYGWFASLRIEEIAARHGRALQWHSMLLGVAVMKVMGLKPMLDTPLKGDYVRRDVLRTARRHRLALRRDLDAPMHPLPAARAFQWVKHHQPQLAAPMAHALYDALWAQGRELRTAAQVAAIALPAGIDAQALEQGIQSPLAARLLRSEVAASLAAGVFGSPTVVVDGELFWGADRLPDVDEWLARGGW